MIKNTIKKRKFVLKGGGLEFDLIITGIEQPQGETKPLHQFLINLIYNIFFNGLIDVSKYNVNLIIYDVIGGNGDDPSSIPSTVPPFNVEQILHLMGIAIKQFDHKKRFLLSKDLEQLKHKKHLIIDIAHVFEYKKISGKLFPCILSGDSIETYEFLKVVRCPYPIGNKLSSYFYNKNFFKFVNNEIITYIDAIAEHIIPTDDIYKVDDQDRFRKRNDIVHEPFDFITAKFKKFKLDIENTIITQKKIVNPFYSVLDLDQKEVDHYLEKTVDIFINQIFNFYDEEYLIALIKSTIEI